jgi:hypothetical protein
VNYDKWQSSNDDNPPPTNHDINHEPTTVLTTNQPQLKKEKKKKKYINTTTTSDKIKNNFNLIKRVCKDQNISQEILYFRVEMYSQFLVDTQKEIHVNDNDLFKHFLSWYASRKFNQEFALQKEVEWFLDAFNKVSRKKFYLSEPIKQNFTKQFKVGFKEADYLHAIKNLFSSDYSNKWHIDSEFKFATPEYLLRDDNLNKYLNVKHNPTKPYEHHEPMKKAMRLN